MPGLLYRAEQEHGVRLSQSFVVGDKLTDIELAHKTGARGILVLTGYGQEELKGVNNGSGQRPDYIAEDLWDATQWILDHLRVR